MAQSTEFAFIVSAMVSWENSRGRTTDWAMSPNGQTSGSRRRPSPEKFDS
jgi:hypothetical protein